MAALGESDGFATPCAALNEGAGLMTGAGPMADAGCDLVARSTGCLGTGAAESDEKGTGCMSSRPSEPAARVAAYSSGGNESGVEGNAVECAAEWAKIGLAGAEDAGHSRGSFNEGGGTALGKASGLTDPIAAPEVSANVVLEPPSTRNAVASDCGTGAGDGTGNDSGNVPADAKTIDGNDASPPVPECKGLSRTGRWDEGEEGTDTG